MLLMDGFVAGWWKVAKEYCREMASVPASSEGTQPHPEQAAGLFKYLKGCHMDGANLHSAASEGRV